MNKLARDAYRALGAEGFARVDFLVRDEQVFISEINTIPGFTPISLFPTMPAEAGLDFTAVCLRILDLALERHAARARRRAHGRGPAPVKLRPGSRRCGRRPPDEGRAGRQHSAAREPHPAARCRARARDARPGRALAGPRRGGDAVGRRSGARGRRARAAADPPDRDPGAGRRGCSGMLVGRLPAHARDRADRVRAVADGPARAGLDRVVGHSRRARPAGWRQRLRASTPPRWKRRSRRSPASPRRMSPLPCPTPPSSSPSRSARRSSPGRSAIAGTSPMRRARSSRRSTTALPLPAGRRGGPRPARWRPPGRSRSAGTSTPVDLDVATRLGSLAPADVGSTAERAARGTSLTSTASSSARPAAGTAVFGFYSPATRPTDMIPGQVRLLRACCRSRGRGSPDHPRVRDDGTYIPRSTPR